jgi:hypothetical protein
MNSCHFSSPLSVRALIHPCVPTDLPQLVGAPLADPSDMTGYMEHNPSMAMQASLLLQQQQHNLQQQQYQQNLMRVSHEQLLAVERQMQLQAQGLTQNAGQVHLYFLICFPRHNWCGY